MTPTSSEVIYEAPSLHIPITFEIGEIGISNFF